MIGTQFGRWTVIGDPIKSNRGEKKWLCRCECGTQRYVLERSLRYGGSMSCGCLTRERAIQSNSRELTGKVFGSLTVLGPASVSDGKKQGRHWICRCSCGEAYTTSTSLLVSGRRTHCPNPIHRTYSKAMDITGKRFHALTALYPTQKRDRSGFVIWHCRCDCGNTVDLSYNSLLYSNQKSCGCRKQIHNRKLADYLTHVDGTSIDFIRSKKVPVNNTTGCRGVYLIKGQYVAKIVFQKKAYYLGEFDRLEDAVRARKKAEEILFDEVIAYYEQFQKAAVRDPAWAEANPVRICVTQNKNREISVSFLPEHWEVKARLHHGAAD